MVQPERMDKTIRKHASVAELDQIKAQEYRYWQSRPVYIDRLTVGSRRPQTRSLDQRQ